VDRLFCLQWLCKDWLATDKLVSLLPIAQAQGLTVEGEMFDANVLASFAMSHYNSGDPLGSDLPRLSAHVLAMEPWNCSTVGQLLIHLVRGGLALVPYDTDANHDPAPRGGQHAHWGILKGFIWPLDPTFQEVRYRCYY